jgi:hypothetical protein
MWFSEKALVFVDTRSAALAIYTEALSGPRLQRFAAERFVSRARQDALFSDVLADSKEAVARLSRDLRAPAANATLLLPVGAAFPSIVEVSSARRTPAPEVEDNDVVRFRMAPLLPFPVADAEIRTETSRSIRTGAVLAQAMLKSTLVESERTMKALGFPGVSVTSALSAALRGLPPLEEAVDVIFGDSACALAVRDNRGVIQAIHMRLLLEGDDRAPRAIDEARRAAVGVRKIRVLGEDVSSLLGHAGDTPVLPAFDRPELRGGADPQVFPFLGVFHKGPGK